jgi:hypothetical protein
VEQQTNKIHHQSTQCTPSPETRRNSNRWKVKTQSLSRVKRVNKLLTHEVDFMTEDEANLYEAEFMILGERISTKFTLF